MAKPLAQVLVHFLTCGTCGHQSSTLNQDRTAAAMLLHLQYAHSSETP